MGGLPLWAPGAECVCPWMQAWMEEHFGHQASLSSLIITAPFLPDGPGIDRCKHI